MFLNGDQASGFGARISDNGPGFAPRTDKRSPPGHLGLSSMRERAEALGGWVHLDSAEGAGTAIEVWLPQKQESVAEMSAA